MRPTKPIHREDKGWGYEIWIHNSSDYCGKILVLEKGKKCSLHHHIQKKETFYIQSGKLLMKIVEESGEEAEFEMEKGDVLEKRVLEAKYYARGMEQFKHCLKVTADEFSISFAFNSERHLVAPIFFNISDLIS